MSGGGLPRYFMRLRANGTSVDDDTVIQVRSSSLSHRGIRKGNVQTRCAALQLCWY
jgi:hypothetical protein